MAVYLFKIGAGWNLPDGSLTNVEDIHPTNDVNCYPPVALYNPGNYLIRGDGSLYIAGYPAVQWVFGGNPGGKITRLQARYFQDTYCNGGYSGTVTINTLTDNPGTYTRANAVMILPKLPDSGKNFTVFQSYQISLTRIVPLD